MPDFSGQFVSFTDDAAPSATTTVHGTTIRMLRESVAKTPGEQHPGA
jgi:hypothetical protein